MKTAKIHLVIDRRRACSSHGGHGTLDRDLVTCKRCLAVTAKVAPTTEKPARKPYKYEGVALVGDRIRSYDFAGRTDCYVEGVVIRKDAEGKENGYAALVIVVDRDGWPARKDEIRSRIGQTVFVPMELGWSEYDGRVVKL